MSDDWRERVRELATRAGIADVHGAVVKAVLVLGACAVGFAVWRIGAARTTGDSFTTPPSAAGTSASVATASAETTAPSCVVVHVAGCVRHPDVYELASGSRVTDAVKAAGGALGSAKLDALNLARVLVDGEQVYVSTAAEAALGGGGEAAGASAGGAGAVAGGKLNLNTATAEQLDTLPGVGPATAKKIIDDRSANGPFTSVADLQRVSGIGVKKVDSLKDLVDAP